MSKHTPGPWWIDWNVSRLDIFSSDAATLVATLRRSALSEGIDETAKANARLIAAAPELFEALRELYALVRGKAPSLLEDTSGGSDRVAMMCEDAIAKATAK